MMVSKSNRLQAGGTVRRGMVDPRMKSVERCWTLAPPSARQFPCFLRRRSMPLLIASSFPRIAFPVGTAPVVSSQLEDRWRRGENLLAFLFAQPASRVSAALDRQRQYFDPRNGDLWDLFYPGY